MKETKKFQGKNKSKSQEDDFKYIFSFP